jgi:transcriptional regulator with XRE-family HTH domain
MVIIVRYDKLPYERIRNLRIDSNLTQSDIAQRLNLKQNTYSQYEIGSLQYPIEVLIKLADFYQTSIDYLLELTDNPAPYERRRKGSFG